VLGSELPKVSRNRDRGLRDLGNRIFIDKSFGSILVGTQSRQLLILETD